MLKEIFKEVWFNNFKNSPANVQEIAKTVYEGLENKEGLFENFEKFIPEVDKEQHEKELAQALVQAIDIAMTGMAVNLIITSLKSSKKNK